MVKRIAALALVVVLSGCAFQAGPIHLAFGDTEASRCSGDTLVNSDGSYTCDGEHELARGSQVGDNVTSIFTGLFDLVRGILAGLGKGLASVGDSTL